MKIKKTITIDEEVWNKFEEHCKANAQKMSSVFQILIENFLIDEKDVKR